MNVVFHAWKIPDVSITLPTEVRECAIVKSMSRINVTYKIHNPKLKWAYCEHLHSQKGFIYKHKIKVLFLHSNLAEGKITNIVACWRELHKVGSTKHCAPPWHTQPCIFWFQPHPWIYDLQKGLWIYRRT